METLCSHKSLQVLEEADCYVLCIPVDDFDALIQAQYTMELATEKNKDALRMVVATKCDQRSDLHEFELVSDSLMRGWAKTFRSIHYVETSAKDGNI